jgi:hypothetical protein
MHGHISASPDSHHLRCMNMDGYGTMHLSLLSLYNEIGMGTVNCSPHQFAMCYLVLRLKRQNRLSLTWDTIEAVGDRHRKDSFISEDLPLNFADTFTRFRLASGASLAHVLAMRRGDSLVERFLRSTPRVMSEPGRSTAVQS